MRIITQKALRSIAVGAVAVGALVLAFAVGSASTGTATASSDTAPGAGRGLAAALGGADRDGLAKLREDLLSARDLDGDERRAALAKIREDAAAGAYGDRLGKRLDRRGDRREDRRAVIFELLPDELQADLAEVREADQDDRAALLEQIKETALAGGYGEKVRAAAEKLQELRGS